MSTSTLMSSPEPLWTEATESEEPAGRESRAARDSRVAGSAAWAAWGDALGFITEFARTPADVRRRAGTEPVREPLSWQRRVGGRFGPSVELPVGAYSDDTQLRLAV